jgi:adhesin transport system outer membrane protein
MPATCVMTDWPKARVLAVGVLFCGSLWAAEPAQESKPRTQRQGAAQNHQSTKAQTQGKAPAHKQEKATLGKDKPSQPRAVVAQAPAARKLAANATPVSAAPIKPLSAAARNPQPVQKTALAQAKAVESLQVLTMSVGLPTQALTPRGGLSLQYVLDTAMQAHPSLQAARLDRQASAEEQEAVERQRWPTVSAVLENKSSNAAVASTRVLRVEQNLWDAGRISARLREAQANAAVNEVRIGIVSQQLSLQIVNAWQSLMAADGRIAVSQQTLQRLQAYRQQMLRRVQSEASPLIDLELVVSRILQTEVELNQAQNNRAVALNRLEQYSGIEGLAKAVLGPVAIPEMAQSQDLVQWLTSVGWKEAAHRHPSVEKARQEALAAQQRIEVKKAEEYPQVYLRVDQPVGSDNNDVVGFLGLRYTPGAGFSTRVEAQALASRAASLEQAVDAAVRDVTETLFTDRDEFSASRSRAQALEKAVQGSETVLESYGRQFTAGRKTWLDLMNAVRELAQNQYALVDSQAAMHAALYRLQVRMGEPVRPTH